MANTTITNLTPVVTLSGNAELMIVQSGTSYSATAQQIANLNAAAGTVTSITAVSPLYGGTITAAGSIGLTQNSINNTYLSTMAANSLKGNNTGSVAAVQDLTVAQTMTLLGAAPLNSPNFTGTPTAPTPSSGDNSTTLATTAFIKAQSYGTGTVTSVTAGNGLSGGTITTTGTISLPTTGVSASTYGSTTAVPVIAVDTYGRITSASNTQITPLNIGAASASTTISAGTGLSGGGDLSDNRTLALASVSAYAILSNISNVSAVPTGNSLSSILDAVIGTGQGSLIFRNDTQWIALSPGSAGQVLQTQGSSANPTWYSIPSTSGGGTVTSLTPGTNMLFSSNPITVTGTISTVNNPVFSTSVQTPLLIGGTTASSTLTLESTSGAGTSDSIIFKTGSQVTQGIINSSGQVVFGPSIPSTTNLATNKNLTGGASWYGFQSSGTIQSDVTTNAVGIRSVPATAAVTTGGAYTLSNVRMFEAGFGTQGANSQITNLNAYYAGTTYAATSLNAGFISNNNSSTTATISNVAIQSSVFVGAISGTTLTVSSVTSGNIAIGQVLTGTGVTAGTFIVSGSGLSWVVSASQTVSAGTTFTSDQSVTITTSAAHTITRGQPSTLIVATTNTAVNGSFTITSVPATTTFTYTLPAILATALVATNTYIITSIGSTDFTLIGAASNTVGLAFTATGAGTGSGTASLYGVSAADTGTTYQYANRYNFYASGTAPNSFAGGLSVGVVGNTGGSALASSNAAYFKAGASTVYTDIISSGTVSVAPASLFIPGTFAARLATTYTTAATVYISAAPTAGTNVTLTNAYSLYVAAGATQLQALNYTTSVGTTSETVPLVIGGTTASSTLTLESTSGSGTTDAILFKTGSQSERMRIDTSGNVSIGSSGTTTGVNLNIGANIGGSTTAYALYLNGQVQSAVNSTAYYISTQSNLNASTNLQYVTHYSAYQGTISGTIAQSQVGFYADGGLTAGTTFNLGFQGALSVSGTKNWNLYMNGSAPNYLAGSLCVGTSTVGSVAGSINAVGAITFQTTTNNQSYTTTGAGTITISSGTAGTIDNMAIGATTRSTGAFTTLGANGAVTIQTTTNNQSYTTTGAGTITISSGTLGTINNMSIGATTASTGAFTTLNATGIATSTNWYNTTTQTATNTATLTAAQITGPFLLGTPTATASYTLPLASAVETALGTPPTGTGWEFVVFTTAAFAITLLTATGWTLVGSMATGATANSFARFRAAKTGAGAYSLYRIS